MIIPTSTRIGPTAVWRLVQFGITLVFLICALLLRRMDGGQEYWPVFYAFFIGALAILVSLLFGGYIHQYLGYDLESTSGIAIAKLTHSC